MHWKSHLVPSQLACVAPVGTGHGVHEVPHALMSITDGQRPVQACCPVGHEPAQAAAASMHAPRQSCLPDPQEPPHIVPSHVATPSVGGWHAVQDVPQEWMSMLETQPPGHMCWPIGHSGGLGGTSGPESALPASSRASGARSTPPPSSIGGAAST